MGRCPEKDGYFEDPNQCDKYYDCLDGIAEERLCPDGLVFDPFSRKREPCDHYFNVDCGDRLDLQPPKGPSDLCPRLKGFYSHPDPGVCHIFYACVDGTAEEYTCSSGLWFDEYSGVCNWPETTDRKDCKADSYALETSNGFQCPEASPTDEFGQYDPHPKYADTDDCAKFFICLNGISPSSAMLQRMYLNAKTTMRSWMTTVQIVGEGSRAAKLDLAASSLNLEETFGRD